MYAGTHSHAKIRNFAQLSGHYQLAVVLKAQGKRHEAIAEAVTELEAKIANPRQIKLSKDEFLNVVETAAERMKAGSAEQKDALARILFLNVRVDNEKVVEYL